MVDLYVGMLPVYTASECLPPPPPTSFPGYDPDNVTVYTLFSWYCHQELPHHHALKGQCYLKQIQWATYTSITCSSFYVFVIEVPVLTQWWIRGGTCGGPGSIFWNGFALKGIVWNIICLETSFKVFLVRTLCTFSEFLPCFFLYPCIFIYIYIYVLLFPYLPTLASHVLKFWERQIFGHVPIVLFILII